MTRVTAAAGIDQQAQRKREVALLGEVFDDLDAAILLPA